MPHHPELFPRHVAQFRHQVKWQDITLSNVFHVAIAEPPTPRHLDEITVLIHRWFNEPDVDRPVVPRDWLPWTPDTGQLVITTLFGLVPIPGLSILTTRINQTVRSTSDVAFPGACVLMQWDSTGRGHWRHGRSFVGPVRDSLLQGEPEGRLLPDLARQIGQSWRPLIRLLHDGGPVPGLYQLVLRHAEPHFPSDSPEGLWSRIVDGGVRDLRLRRQGRRVPSLVLSR